MRAYLDSNILISIEEGEIKIIELTGMFSTETQFVYSYAHIQELLEASDLESLIPRRTQTLKNVTNNFYEYPDGFTIEFKNQDPNSVIKFYQNLKVLNYQLRSTVQSFDIERDSLLNKLGISKIEMNNIHPDEVVSQLNEILDKQFIPNFQTMIEMSGTSKREQIVSIFNFLDFLGYWTDKPNNKSKMARIYDASHTYFSSACDFFISNDKRARNKAKVAFHMLNIQTKVLSLKELLELKARE
ncbi:MAG: hypothetical protein COW03_03910 [Cytophagales bacterium CG12_big_fil_rev_8_21_14_0_65_40_12]|nr:MAG: hypothetical protein COW03_03910 [Cytophagales bacterium CG12_big_fil_rev_8_21_14_0_65_40_12]PIW03709.1 MAG: hypothetical protein COW40_13650 [Cytophagales bacterium CG17_big_fil_post_rev_8_21_14_2_50_40_13]